MTMRNEGFSMADPISAVIAGGVAGKATGKILEYTESADDPEEAWIRSGIEVTILFHTRLLILPLVASYRQLSVVRTAKSFVLDLPNSPRNRKTTLHQQGDTRATSEVDG